MTEEQKKKVWLSITSRIADASGQNDRTEFVTEGELSHVNQAVCLTYQETEISGMEGTTTTLKVEDGKISIIRLGKINSLMEFEQGRHSTAMYTTPYGDVPMGIGTKKLDTIYDEEGDPVRIEMIYEVDIQGQLNSRNALAVEIRKGNTERVV